MTANIKLLWEDTVKENVYTYVYVMYVCYFLHSHLQNLLFVVDAFNTLKTAQINK